MKRRHLLKFAGGSLALAGIGLPAGTARADASGADAAGTNAAGPDNSAFAWNRASAQGLVGQSFWLNHPEAGAMAIVLAAVGLPHTKNAADSALRIDQFSLVFHGPLQPQVAGDTYALDHPLLGRFDLYLSPGGRAGGNAVYRSDFSLLP